jgi:5'(3')-deoxyribonucleotidase
MEKLTILCDLDGIVADLLTPWLSRYNADYGDNLTVTDITDWDIHNCVKSECGEKIYDYINEPGFYFNLKPLPGAIDTINSLRNDGHEVVFVTASASAPHTAEEKLRWIEKHFGMSRRDVFIGHKKHLVKGDVFIDDSPKNLMKYREAWPDALICTIAYPHNVGSDVDFRAVSCTDTATAWNGILRAIRNHVA